MNKRTEPVPLFKAGDVAYQHTCKVRVLSITTYCTCCNRFLDEAKYSIQELEGEKRIIHGLEEKHLMFEEELPAYKEKMGYE